MPFRVAEVIAVLFVVGAILVAKHVPVLATLPLAQMAGIVCFAFAIYMALRIFQQELARIRAGE